MGKKGIEGGEQFPAALVLMEEVILDQPQLKLKGNQDVGPITYVAVLKINETGEIRNIYRAICEIPEKPNEIELETKQEMGNGRCDLGEIQEVNSADRIDQLNDLRFKIQSGKFNLSRAKSAKISENKIPGMRKEF